MNQLDYIKSKFLEKSILVDFIASNDDLSERYVDFQKTLKNTNELIKKSENIESVMSHIEEAQRRFLVHWQFIHQNEEHPSYKKMSSIYFSANLDLPEEWLKTTNISFEEKKSNKFFDLTSKGLKFIGEKISITDVNTQEIEIFAQEIIKKYNLNHINLSDTKNSQHMSFLTRLNNGLENVCNSMGVTSDIIGIYGTVGFSSTPHTEAFFLSEKNSITVGGLMQNSSTLLHEWIHSLDYYVGNSIIPGQFASNIEEAIHIEDSNIYNSFISIKKLTQEIFNSSRSLEHIEPMKIALVTEGTSKFFSELLGYDFYLLPDTIKYNLHSKQSFELVNNYLVTPSSEDNQIKLLDFIKSQNLHTTVIADKIKNPSLDITSLKAFFDTVNKNLFTKPSLYHISSKLSIFGLKANLLLETIVNKGINLFKKDVVEQTKGNSHDDDYYIQPIEMVARYFESQVFPKTTRINNILNMIVGVCSYKMTTDDTFEKNKNQIIENVFSRDKLLKNISSIRKKIIKFDQKTEFTIKKSNF